MLNFGCNSRHVVFLVKQHKTQMKTVKWRWQSAKTDLGDLLPEITQMRT